MQARTTSLPGLAQDLEHHRFSTGFPGINYVKADQSQRVIFELSTFFLFLEKNLD